MKYFAIENSMSTKIVGKIPHTKEILHNCDVWEEPRFIDRMFFKKIEGTPILSNAVLFPKAKITDFINTYSAQGFSMGSLLISDKFKNILEKFNVFGFQFFSTYMIQNDDKIKGFWQTHNYKFAFKYIDFPNTEIYLKNAENRIVDYSKKLEFKNENEFIEFADKSEYPFSPIISKIKFIESMDLDYFKIRFFELGGSRGIVSENLKKEIEKEGITGLEFRPIEVSLQDWLRSEEREKIYGKI